MGRMQIQIPEHIERKSRVLVIGVGIVMAAACVVAGVFWRQGRYDLLLHIDVPLHLFGGFAASLTFLLLIVIFHGERPLRAMPYWLRVLLVLGFCGLVTIAWELFEHFTDTHLGTNLQSTVIETLKDMVVGLAGAAPAAFWLTMLPFSDRDDSGSHAAGRPGNHRMANPQ